MSVTFRRPTRQRAAVEALLVNIGDFMSAQDLHARLRAQGQGVGLATVYRTLQAMAADGDVDMMRTSDGEAVYPRCSAGHPHPLACRHRAETGVRCVHRPLEIFGLCSTCPAGLARLPGPVGSPGLAGR